MQQHLSPTRHGSVDYWYVIMSDQRTALLGAWKGEFGSRLHNYSAPQLCPTKMSERCNSEPVALGVSGEPASEWFYFVLTNLWLTPEVGCGCRSPLRPLRNFALRACLLSNQVIDFLMLACELRLRPVNCGI
jgi:hypothetical protein